LIRLCNLLLAVKIYLLIDDPEVTLVLILLLVSSELIITLIRFDDPKITKSDWIESLYPPNEFMGRITIVDWSSWNSQDLFRDRNELCRDFLS